jgi:hypothetical protein
MSKNSIQEMVSSLAKTLDDNEQLATPILSSKLAKYQEVYPYDQTVGMMSRVIEKMASNNTLFIKKADFRSLYQKMYSTGTKLAELFPNELGAAYEPKIERTKYEIKEVEPYQIKDQVLANALANAFDSSIPLRAYAQASADKAVKIVSSSLDNCTIHPTEVSIADGNERILLIKADYDTPKGITSIYVPVEVVNNKVADAGVFIGNTGVIEINNQEVKNYIVSNAGAKLKATAKTILAFLTNAISGNKEISDTELALIKLNSERQEKASLNATPILGQKIAEVVIKDVVLPKSDEFSSFEKEFSSPYGVASFTFGENKIKIGRESIERELIAAGYKNPQVIVSACNEGTVFYAVSISGGRIGFTVPVKIANGKVSKPDIMLCNGSVSSFSKEGINMLSINNQSDFKAASVASPLYGLKSSELIANIKQALAEGNTAKAEDALNILEKSGNDNAYAIGFAAFIGGLNKTASAPVEEKKCSMIIKSAASQHPYCGHCNLPLHKTYVDEDGHCRPLYRKGMNTDYDSVLFNTSKILG